MPVKRKVYSVNIQMILSLIPLVDFWAAYRIEKLTFWILLWIGSIVMGFGVGVVIPDPTSSFIVATIIESIIAVGLMRYFTMNWNAAIKSGEIDSGDFEKL